MKTVQFLSGLSLFLVSLTATADLRKLSYQLPESKDSDNQIQNIQVDGDTVVILHNSGISFSHDGGHTFREADFEDHKVKNPDKPIANPILHIDHEDHSIYVLFHDHLFKSVDFGSSFKKLSSKYHYDFQSSCPYEFDYITTLGQHVAFATYRYRFGAPVNFIDISHDGGKTCEKKTVGMEKEQSPTYSRFHEGILYVRSLSWFASNDLGDTFSEIGSIHPSIIQKWISDELNIYQTLSTLEFPPFERPTLQTFERLRTSIQYKNSRFNVDVPQPEIGYRLSLHPSEGERFVSSDLVPRFAAFEPNSRTVYYTSFKDAWKITSP